MTSAANGLRDIPLALSVTDVVLNAIRLFADDTISSLARKGWHPAMPLYLVSYDIPVKNEAEYQELWHYLDELGSVKILYSEYAVPFDGTALKLADKINKEHLKPGDRLLVCELFNGQVSAWVNLRIKDDVFIKLLTDFARPIQ
jgi:hypothetical protein